VIYRKGPVLTYQISICYYVVAYPVGIIMLWPLLILQLLGLLFILAEMQWSFKL